MLLFVLHTKLSGRFLGYDKLLEFVIFEWLTDIKSYQLPRIIGGVGPMYYITQLGELYYVVVVVVVVVVVIVYN